MTPPGPPPEFQSAPKYGGISRKAGDPNDAYRWLLTRIFSEYLESEIGIKEI